MSTYSSELSDTSCSETTPSPLPPATPNDIKKKKRKHNFDGGKLLKYYKYLYEQKCKESEHYKKLYRAKNKECEQLTLLNQQYQGRVIAYLLENHTNNASSYASSISSSSQNDVCLRDDDYHHETNDVDDLITTMHDSDSSHQTAQNQLHNNTSNDEDAMNLNSVKNYDFVVDRYGNRTYNVNNKHTVHLTSSQLADLEAFPNDMSQDSKFTYYLLKAIYGTEVLAASSRTGRKCNSIKGAVSKPALDQDLLHFVKSLYAQRVNSNYARLKKFNSYVNKKCSSSALFANSTPIKASVVIKSENVLYE